MATPNYRHQKKQREEAKKKKKEEKLRRRSEKTDKATEPGPELPGTG